MALFSMTNDNKPRLDLAIGVICGVVAFAAYAATLSPGFYPGVSTAMAARIAGLIPATIPDHPSLTLVARGLLKAFGLSPWAFNLFSAVCGALSAALCYRLVSRALFAAIRQDVSSEAHAVRASVLGGVFATVALAFSMAAWTASTRFMAPAWDLLILLVVFTMVAHHLRTGHLRWVAGAAFLLGAGIVETPAFVPFAAVIGIWLIRSWVRSQTGIKGRHLATLLAFGLLGLCMYLVAGWHFAALNGVSGNAEQASFLSVVWRFLRTQLRWSKAFFTGGSPWILVILFSLVPWLVVQLTATAALNEVRDWVYYVIHVAWTLFTLLVLGNATGSPWNALSPFGRVPVFLQACASTVAGYLVAYWYLMMVNRTIATSSGKQARVRLGVWLGYLFTVPLMVLICATIPVNFFRATGTRGRFAGECAAELLDSIGERRWIVGDGIFDSQILVEAARRGRDIRMVSLGQDTNKTYLEKLRGHVENDPEFEGLDRVRLGNATRLGTLAFLQDWMSDDPSIGEKIAVMNVPDLLFGSGLTVVPCRFCFVGQHDSAPLKDRDFLGEYQPFWDRMEKKLPRVKRRDGRDTAEFFLAYLRRQVGFVANNLGVLLEDVGRPEDAFTVYRRVRTLDPENASAVLNLMGMVADGVHPELEKEIQKDAEAFVKNLSGHLPIWALSRHFGYVRDPELFAQLGLSWALSGHPTFALSGLARAIELAPESARASIERNIADLLLQQNEQAQSEAIYADILRQDPTNQRALLSMAHISMSQGAFDKTREWLEKAQNAGVDTTRLAVEWASVYLASGEPDRALVELKQVTELQPQNLRAWGLLALAQIQLDMPDEAMKTLGRMESLTGGPDNFLIQITRGQLAYRRGSEGLAEARDAFERAYALHSSSPVILEWILRLDFAMKDKRRGESHAIELLRQNRENYLGNYIMGSIMMDYGRPVDAEQYFRRSIAAARNTAALNDLAELLRQNHRPEEGEPFAREAVERDPELAVAHDTLACILEDTGRADEAEAEFEAAIRTAPDDNGVVTDFRPHIHFARFLRKKGNMVRARELANLVQSKRASLPEDVRRDLDILLLELKPRMN